MNKINEVEKKEAEFDEIIVHVSKKNRSIQERQIVSTYKGQENGDIFRLVRYTKGEKAYSGIEIKKTKQKAGWSMVTKAERSMEPAMWESYWRHKALSGEITMNEAIIRTAAYMIDIFGSLEDILINGQNPEIANALNAVLKNKTS